MTEKLIVMSKPNIPPLLAKPPRKLRTMRTGGLKEINQNPDDWDYRGFNKAGKAVFRHVLLGDLIEVKPRYQVGDRLLVAEGYQITNSPIHGIISGKYLADNTDFKINISLNEWRLWRKRKHLYRPTSGRFMYKSLVRISMVVTAVTAQRPQDLTGDECRAEGISFMDEQFGSVFAAPMYIQKFKTLWNSLHKDGWEKNEWCFVYHWQKVEEVK